MQIDGKKEERLRRREEKEPYRTSAFVARGFAARPSRVLLISVTQKKKIRDCSQSSKICSHKRRFLYIDVLFHVFYYNKAESIGRYTEDFVIQSEVRHIEVPLYWHRLRQHNNKKNKLFYRNSRLGNVFQCFCNPLYFTALLFLVSRGDHDFDADYTVKAQAVMMPNPLSLNAETDAFIRVIFLPESGPAGSNFQPSFSYEITYCRLICVSLGERRHLIFRGEKIIFDSRSPFSESWVTPSLTFMGRELVLEHTANDLRVILDTNLTCDERITKPFSSCMSCLSQISRTKHFWTNAPY